MASKVDRVSSEHARKLRKIRYQKTRYKKLLVQAMSGLTDGKLIDQSWLVRALRKSIDELEKQEREIVRAFYPIRKKRKPTGG